MLYHQIKGNMVVAVVECELSLEIEEIFSNEGSFLVPFTEGVRITDLYFNSAYHPQIMNVQDFKDRFTQTEQMTILQAQFTNPVVGQLMLDLYTAPYISLNSPKVAYGLLYFTTVGILAEGRMAEILT